MTSVCPAGHDSTADDYCDVCGTPIEATAVIPAVAGSSAAAGAPPSAAGAAPTATGQACPNCGTANVAEALFCESCGYDFTTGSMPRPLTPPQPAADVEATPTAPEGSASPAGGAPSGGTPAGGAPSEGTPAGGAPSGGTPSAGTAFSWVAELWIDPAWYEAQDSPDPLPSPGLPATIPLRHSSVLVGRASRSRNIAPDVDCGADSGVSRRQSQLTTDGSRWFVEDLESANGTFIGRASGTLPEDPIPVGVKRELEPDDRIYLGAWTRLVIREATEDEIASLA
jgi:hypothetical protein